MYVSIFSSQPTILNAHSDTRLLKSYWKLQEQHMEAFYICIKERWAVTGLAIITNMLGSVLAIMPLSASYRKPRNPRIVFPDAIASTFPGFYSTFNIKVACKLWPDALSLHSKSVKSCATLCGMDYSDAFLIAYECILPFFRTLAGYRVKAIWVNIWWLTTIITKSMRICFSGCTQVYTVSHLECDRDVSESSRGRNLSSAQVLPMWVCYALTTEE